MERLQWVDVAKGIGILIVIIGHELQHVKSSPVSFILDDVVAIIYAFHIPLFFFLSGVLLNHSASFKQFTVKKLSRLLLPYFVSCLIFSIVSFLSYLIFKNPVSFSWFQCLYACAFGTHDILIQTTGVKLFAILWFLPALFCASLIGYCIITAINKNTLMGSILFLVIVSCGYSCSLLHLQLPWSLDIAMVSQIFVIPGYYFIKNGPKINPVAAILALLVFAIAFHFNGVPVIVVAKAIYNNLFLFWVAAISGVMVVIYISQLIIKSPAVEKPFIFFGNNTLVIFCFHTVAFYIVHLLALAFPVILIIYNSSIAFSIIFAVGVSLAFVFAIRKIPLLNRIYGTQ